MKEPFIYFFINKEKEKKTMNKEVTYYTESIETTDNDDWDIED